MPIVQSERSKFLQRFVRPKVYGLILGVVVALGLVAIFHNPIEDFLYRVGVLYQDATTVLSEADGQQRLANLPKAITILQQGLRRTSTKTDEIRFDNALAAYYQARGDNNSALKYYLDGRALAPNDHNNSEAIGNILHT